MTLLPDGSLQFKEGEVIPPLRIYRPHESIPLRFVAKFELPCLARQFTGGLSPCKQRMRFDWHCSKFKMGVSISICKECKEPEL